MKDRSARDDFKQFVPISTRWSDIDIYGHVNNVVYLSFFDTGVNQGLIEAGVLVPETSPTIGLVVETNCQYFAPLHYPGQIEVGLRTIKLGNSSVTYRIGIFEQGQDLAAAQGLFTHVYVDRASRKPTPIPDAHRAYMTTIYAPISDAAT